MEFRRCNELPVYLYKNEKAYWGRCDRCGQLNIVSDQIKTNCENCKIVVNVVMRELDEQEYKDNVILIK